MNAIYLHLPDGTATKWSMCTECGQVAAPGNYDLSQKCCTCYDCGEPLPKDERIPYAEGRGKSLYHRACQEKRYAKRQAELLEKAELVSDYDGPVYCEGVGGSDYGDGYFSSLDVLTESLDDEADDTNRPEFAFCCTGSAVSIDLNSILENACEEHFEDARDSLEGVEDLEEAVKLFNFRNSTTMSWYEDRKHKVAVPARAPETETPE